MQRNYTQIAILIGLLIWMFNLRQVVEIEPYPAVESTARVATKTPPPTLPAFVTKCPSA